MIFTSSDILFRDGGFFSYIVFALLLLMIVVACKRFYAQNWFWTIVKSVLFLAFFEFVIIDIIYNFILFFTVNLSI
jgi:hypothetical protein